MSPNHPIEGSFKFTCHLTPGEIGLRDELFEALNHWRQVMWEKGLIGVYTDGIGYGNISIRLPGGNRFCISGTATGCLPELTRNHYAMVEGCDVEKNTVWCRGALNASAESMSHSAIYTSLPDVMAVVHIHNRPLWERYLGILPTTSPEVEYGTPAMAGEITRILSLPETLQKKVIIMGGHEEGVIAFGKTVEEAGLIVLELQEDVG
jgi:ribulose-5-phosphate 4-epimerase/fuculose-1-phosphate aldolase